MRYPEFIKKNDKISLVAPSFGCTTSPYKERLKVAIKNLKNIGFVVDEGKNIRLAKGVVSSNTPKLRAKEIIGLIRSLCDLLYPSDPGFY